MNANEKVAIVTGAGSGIGKYSTLALLEAGYHVVLAGRRFEALESTAKESNLPETRFLTISTDVSDPMAVQELFAKTLERFGRLDLLFNNAGVAGETGLLEDTSYTQWKKILDTNLTGSFLCTQEAFKIMKQQSPMGGRIINNGSTSAHSPRPNSVAYTSAKHAITGLTKSTSLDGRKYNIVCSQIDIGNASTVMTARMEKGILQANGEVVAEPTMDVSHIAQAIVYIAELPLTANVQFMTILASQMPFIGRG